MNPTTTRRKNLFSLIKADIVHSKDEEKIILIAPRRIGKTTLIKNILDDLLLSTKEEEILVVVPCSSHIYSSNKYFNRNISFIYMAQQLDISKRFSVVLVEEGAYVDNSILSYVANIPTARKLIVSTPKPVEYYINRREEKVSKNYLKFLIDNDLSWKKYHLSIDSHDTETQKDLLCYKNCYSNDEWTTEFLAEWTELHQVASGAFILAAN